MALTPCGELPVGGPDKHPPNVTTAATMVTRSDWLRILATGDDKGRSSVSWVFRAEAVCSWFAKIAASPLSARNLLRREQARACFPHDGPPRPLVPGRRPRRAILRNCIATVALCSQFRVRSLPFDAFVREGDGSRIASKFCSGKHHVGGR